MKSTFDSQRQNQKEQKSVLMDIAIVSYDFMENSKNSRPLLTYQVVLECLSPKSVQVYCANFSHHKKKYVKFQDPHFHAVDVPGYKYNISLMRVLSYWIFSLKIIFRKELRDSSLIYFCVPANELAIVALIYKYLFHKTVVLDVVDIWPEAFPLPPLLNPWIKSLWYLTSRPIRNLLFRQADLIITQSAYFKQKLASPKNCKVVLMGTTHKMDTRFKTSHRGDLQDCIYILYLGSINSINDLGSLIGIITRLKVHRPVHLSVIGGGKRLDYLKEKIEALGISSEFHGICFDHDLKNQEFLRCHFGYNGYVPSTEVAISYKSLEYLAHGLPLLNSTKGDTHQLIESDNCGFNFAANSQCLDDLAEKILSLSNEQYYEMQQRSLDAFEQNFAWPVFKERLTDTLRSLDNPKD
ncbi:MAG: glycosyltransferase [Microcystaceae cyanobacterium]